MKRVSGRALSLLLALWLLTGTAWAAESVSLAVSFRQEDQFYGFAVLERRHGSVSGELRSAGVTLPLRLGPVRLADSGLPATCLLLVDRSGSMKDMRGWVTRLVAALEDGGETDARFLLATFGEEFSLEWDGQEGSAAGAAEKIAYTAQKTDLSQGVLDAAEYLRNRPREPGELLNLVVITDGIPDTGEDSPSLTEAARLLAEDSSLLVHTVGLRTGAPGAQAALETLETLGRGVHPVCGGQRDAKNAGEELAAFVDSLCVVGFPWTDQNPGDMELTLHWEDAGEAAVPLDMASVPVLAAAADGPGTPEETEDPEKPGDAPNAPEDLPQPSDGPDAPEPSDGAGEPGGPGEAVNAGGGNEKPGGWIRWAAVGAAALALLAVLLPLLFKKRRGAAPPPPRGSIYMRMEVLSGAYAGPAELYLTDELTVGRGRRCDIRWKDRDLAPQNSRIFLRDNMVYIEDLRSPQGTALGGMRLHSPNRLRSGDEISIGPVRFRLKF